MVSRLIIDKYPKNHRTIQTLLYINTQCNCKDPSLWKVNKASSGAEDNTKSVEVGIHKTGHWSKNHNFVYRDFLLSVSLLPCSRKGLEVMLADGSHVKTS